MNYYTNQVENLGKGDAFAVKIENRSAHPKIGTAATKWLSITADQKNRIAEILAEGDEYYTLRVEDVGQAVIQAFGKSWPVEDFMGNVLPGDVGKRVFARPTAAEESRYLTVENDEQRSARLAKSQPSQTERYINTSR